MNRKKRQLFLENVRKYFPRARLRRVSTLTTFGVGRVQCPILVTRTPQTFMKACEAAIQTHIPYSIIAGGTNVVFPDSELNKLLILNRGGTIRIDKNRVSVDAGVSLDRLVHFTIAHGYKGLETLSGIPGTVGGALYGNAGAYGRTISDYLKSVYVFEGDHTHTVMKRDCAFAYRDSLFKRRGGYAIISAEFAFPQGDSQELLRVSRTIIRTRRKKYPPHIKCPGSFFKNVLMSEISKEARTRIDTQKVIEGKVPAGYLLESVGMCGKTCGGIFVAPYHGNLFINYNKATHADVARCARQAKKLVREKFLIDLEEEVRFIA